MAGSPERFSLHKLGEEPSWNRIEKNSIWAPREQDFCFGGVFVWPQAFTSVRFVGKESTVSVPVDAGTAATLLLNETVKCKKDDHNKM